MAGMSLVAAAVAGAVLAQQAAPPHVAIEVQGRGTIVVRLEKAHAPKLVSHFLGLVDRKFYDGMLWHRKVENFVIQTGDPASRDKTPEWARARPGERGGTRGLGDGGSGTSVPFEINDLVHDRYTVGMALESPMDDSGDSQFFINLKANHRLNGMYVVFGTTVSGQRVVDAVERGDRILTVRRVRR
jgi:peptidyl-prolyl cis-trans isomerase B (cyclophilin B)